MYPKVKFYVEGGMYSEFLNSLTESFSLLNITPEKLGFTATCYASDYKHIARLSKKFQCRISIKEKIGFYFKINKFTGRKGVRAGIVIYLILSFIFSHIVWNISINTTDLNLKSEILNSLYRQGIHAGSYFEKQKLADACKNTMIELEDYADISLNFYKGVIHCNVNKRYIKEDYLKGTNDGDIKSSLSGIVTDVRVYSGFPKVETGQSVSAGDVIVACIELDQFNNVYYEKTRAYIEALCDKTYSVYIPYEKECDLYTGETSKEIHINILNKKFKIKDSNCNEWNDKTSVSKVKYLSFLGFHLPITTEETTFYRIETFKISNDALSLDEIAKYQIRQMIQNDVKLKEEVRKTYDYKLKDDGLQLICTVNGYYEIT